MRRINKQKFNSILFRWFRNNERDLPWRRTSDPYAILVSEIMLQQTQADRVVLKYKEFLKQFPTVQKLAAASLGDVLRVWSGLGYNRRAKYLHDCAKIVTERYGGSFPNDFDELQTLPGIGRSTAAALCSFAFRQSEPMIDTNIRRIICRVFYKKKIPNDKIIYNLAKELISKNKGRDWNWAMMDVGAMLCKAKNHNDRCPFQKMHGNVNDFIYKKQQRSFKNSNRYYRGKILQSLAAAPRGCEIEKLRARLKIDKERYDVLLGALVSESLVRIKGADVCLP